MKVWTGYGTEHSSNLVIIGNFKTVEDAKEATSMIHELTEIVQADCTDGLIDVERPYSRYSERLMDFTKKTNFSCDRIGPMGLLYEYSIKQEGKQINIHTDDEGYRLLLDLMIHKGAKIEMFSAHDYK